MTRPPDLNELRNCMRGEYNYDFEQASQVLKAMDALRKDAVLARIPKIVAVVDSALRILLASYYTILRDDMTELQGTDDPVS